MTSNHQYLDTYGLFSKICFYGSQSFKNWTESKSWQNFNEQNSLNI